MRNFGLVLVGLVLAGALTACGGSSGGALSLDPVAKAAAKTIHSSGEKVKLSAEITVGGQSITMTGGGVMNSTAADLTIFAAPFASKSLTLREVYVIEKSGPIVYFSSPQFGSELPFGKKWVRLDLGKAAKKQFGMSNLSSSNDPSQFLRLLRSRGLEPAKVGEETIDGQSTTKYHVDLDLEKAANEAGASEEGLKALREQMTSKTVPIDAWIDKTGYLRREHVTFDLGAASMSMTITLSDFGRPVSIKPPPAKETVGVDSLTSKQ
jgi:hypothetical protein